MLALAGVNPKEVCRPDDLGGRQVRIPISVRLKLAYLKFTCFLFRLHCWKKIDQRHDVTLYGEPVAEGDLRGWEHTHDLCLRCWTTREKR